MHLKQKINQNQVILGTMLSEVYTPNIARVIKAGGMDYIIIDCEHGYFDFSQTANIVAVCKGFDLPVIIRIPSIQREFITKALDMGADGLLVPMVNSVEDVTKVISYAKYAPLGSRGISGTRAHTNYDSSNLSSYVKQANETTIVLAQIETKEALTDAEKIASVEGVDGLIIGPNDLAMDLGTPGAINTEEMKNAVETVIHAASRANKASGIVTSELNFIHECKAKGMTIFSCNSEVGMIKKSTTQIVNEFR